MRDTKPKAKSKAKLKAVPNSPGTNELPPLPIIGVFKAGHALNIGAKVYPTQDGLLLLTPNTAAPNQQPITLSEAVAADTEVVVLADGTGHKMTDAFRAQIAEQQTRAGMIQAAENRKNVLQTEAAINIGIGLILNAFKQSEITIHPDAVTTFNMQFRVTSSNNPDGSVTLNVLPRK